MRFVGPADDSSSDTVDSWSQLFDSDSLADSPQLDCNSVVLIRWQLYNVHEYDAEHLGRHPVKLAGAVLIKLRAAMSRFRQRFVASRDLVALVRALESAVIHFVKPLALLRVLEGFYGHQRSGMKQLRLATGRT